MTNEYEPTPEEIDDAMQRYLDMGVMEVVGQDENGEDILRLTELADVLAPELAEIWRASQRDEIEEALMGLVEKGLVEFEYPDVTLEPVFRLTDDGKAVADEIIRDYPHFKPLL